MAYKEGDIVEGVVTGIEDYGAFITFDNGYTGLVHISEISERFVDDVSDFFKLGEKIELKVVSVYEDEKKLKLTIKYKNKKATIKEVGQGFELLKNSLDGWIDEKILQMNEKNSKKED